MGLNASFNSISIHTSSTHQTIQITDAFPLQEKQSMSYGLTPPHQPTHSHSQPFTSDREDSLEIYNTYAYKSTRVLRGFNQHKPHTETLLSMCNGGNHK